MVMKLAMKKLRSKETTHHRSESEGKPRRGDGEQQWKDRGDHCADL